MITREDIEKAKSELAEEHDPWPLSGGMFEGQAKALSFAKGFEVCLELLYPFLDAYQKREVDPKRGIFPDERQLFFDLKKKLGMPLKEWEK